MPMSRSRFPNWQRPAAILFAYVIALQVALSGLVLTSGTASAAEQISATCVHRSALANTTSAPATDESAACPCCVDGCISTSPNAADIPPNYGSIWHPPYGANSAEVPNMDWFN